MHTSLLYTLTGQLVFNGKIVEEIMELPKEDRRALMEAIHQYPAYLESIVDSVGGPEAAVRLDAPDRAFKRGHYSIIHPSTYKRGYWQHSWFRPNNEPGGHTVWLTRLEAIKDAQDFQHIFIHEICVLERVAP